MLQLLGYYLVGTINSSHPSPGHEVCIREVNEAIAPASSDCIPVGPTYKPP